MIKIKIVIVDDHPVFIRGLMMLLSSVKKYSVEAAADSIVSALEAVKTKMPDVVIVDLNLGDEDGLDLIKQLHDNFPEIKILVLSMLNERVYANKALASGALGFVMKDEDSNTILSALDSILKGNVWISPKEIGFYNQKIGDGSIMKERKSVSSLSERQLQIFELMGKGHGSMQIAETLFISRKTVEAHKGQIKEKLGCSSAQELLQLAIEWTTDR